jgi:MYXO-CTERM domain-containing protein
MSMKIRSMAAFGLVALLAAESQATVFTASFADDSGRGYLDPTPVQPVGGNPGTSVGQQRRIVFERALAVFAGRLQSTQPIRVLTTFSGDVDGLECTPTAAVLGGAAAHHAVHYRGPAGAPHPMPGVLYHAALADSLAGHDHASDDPDVVAHFNGRIGTSGCGDDMRWYYGLDGQAPTGAVDMFTVVLHELAHALGFSDFTNRDTGQFSPDGQGGSIPGVFALFLYDAVSGKRWPALTPEQRLVSRQNTGNLLWDGPTVRAVSGAGGGCTGAGSRVRMYAPSTFQPGSSVSHWDTSCSPNLLMEPSFTGRGFLDLTPALLADLGWRVNGSCGDGHADDGEQCDRGGSNGTVCSAVCTGSAVGICGDGIIGAGEQCDQGTANGTPESCCSSSCAIKAANTSCRTGACETAMCNGQSARCPDSCTLPGGPDGGAPADAATTDGAREPDGAVLLPDALPLPLDSGKAPSDASLVVNADAAPDASVAMADLETAAGCSCDSGRGGGARGGAIVLLLGLILSVRRRR